MAELEKVIKGLEHCIEGGSCEGCPYFIKYSSRCIFSLHADVLAMLKEQQEEIDNWIEAYSQY